MHEHIFAATVWFDGFISEDTLERVRTILTDSEKANEWAEENYQLAKRYFSFTVLERRLKSILADCFGEQV